jgi:hypothetical protein
MATDQIRYDLLVQEALRGVVRKVLANAARDGLPGEHYFHVEFETAASGVRLSDRMRERFPDRMTIILQHHFWDLEVTEEAMEVGLSFGGVAERVRVPFAALTGFFDESVQFGLRFELQDAAARREPEAPPRPAKAEKPRLTDIAREPKESPAKDAPAKGAPHKEPARPAAAKEAAARPEADEKAAHEGDGAKVLSIDAFRKKP